MSRTTKGNMRGKATKRKAGVFEYSKCTYSTSRRYSLKIHKKNCGTKKKIQLLCHLCQKQFDRNNHYTKHINTHKKENRFYCNPFPMSFIETKSKEAYK